MKLKLNLNYKREKKHIEVMSNIGLSANYINFAIEDAHKEGLQGQMKRTVGRIQRKLDECVEKNMDKIDLEQTEVDIIKKSFEKASAPTNTAKYWVILEDEIEKLNDKTIDK